MQDRSYIPITGSCSVETCLLGHALFIGRSQCLATRAGLLRGAFSTLSRNIGKRRFKVMARGKRQLSGI